MNFEKIGDIVEVYDSLHHTPKNYLDSGYPMVRVKDIKQGFLTLRDVAYVDEDVYKEFTKKYIPQIGDVVLSRVGSYGIPCFVQTNEVFCLGQNTVVLHPVEVEPKYLYYCLSSNIVQNQIEKLVTGSTQKTISLKSIKEVEIPFPNKETQEKVGDFFFNIDSKLNANKEIIDNVEELSQTLFKHWFIDFEFPNEEGLPYKSSGGKMVESELGEIPEGWKVYKLNDFTESVSKSINKNNIQFARFLNTSDILEGYVGNVDLSPTDKMPGQAKKLIKKDDILYSEIRPKNKRYAFVNFDSYEYVVSTKLMVLRVDKEIYSSKLLYLWLIMPEVINELQQIAEDRSGTFPQITFNTLSEFKFVIPNQEVLNRLAEPLEKLIDVQMELKEENEKLIELRDSLLPKLLSGEIEIPDESVVD
ncbi:restriction endonuclease subunit S [Paenibacillus segetis]|uniref:Specificity protein S n=1 Tax=Paenibacillus segetis TaxID=1325360 RepID=A0ABQ1Y423_9BACL|nr:restriction endonuclease subunit S [Paenibacillus segetis]GGH11356.1 specificity protein S [Paenibacillus segetis]